MCCVALNEHHKSVYLFHLIGKWAPLCFELDTKGYPQEAHIGSLSRPSAHKCHYRKSAYKGAREPNGSTNDCLGPDVTNEV